ncbi:RFX-like DNA-binding protein Rfx2p [Diutina catenulata]
MSNPNYRSHKRQKSSVSNLGYHFPSGDPGVSSPTTPGPMYHSTAATTGATTSQPNVAGDYMGYSFPPRQPDASAPATNPTMVPPLQASSSHSHHASAASMSSHPSEFSSPHRGDYSSVPTGYYDPVAASHFSPSQAPSSIANYSYTNTTTPLNQQQTQYPPYEPYTPANKQYRPTSGVGLGHKANNLSISSHFNLFSLADKSKPTTSPTTLGGPPQGYAFPAQIPQSNSQAMGPPATGNAGAITPHAILNELYVQLMSVDAGNINNYLLSILQKLAGNPTMPVDDFYNLLYNCEQGQAPAPALSSSQRIDKTYVTPGQTDGVVEVITNILNVFKTPNLLLEIFPDLANKENKLISINYHELLRTFLAIKILFDMLIEMPQNGTGDKEPQHYTIPRLSIYKTYFILCHKLILTYPSSSNTVGEQQKLILGQSKLGKLIKLVYPDLMIKRLGSRGESKYNYLGVVWNDNVINSEVKQLCDESEIAQLTQMFNEQAAQAATVSPKKRSRKVKQEPFPELSYQMPPVYMEPSPPRDHLGSAMGPPSMGASVMSSAAPPMTEGTAASSAPPLSATLEPLVNGPTLSFIKPSSKYPLDDNFTILADTSPNWFNDLCDRLYSGLPSVSPQLIRDIFLSNENLRTKQSLLENFMDLVVTPLGSSGGENVDLKIYLVVIIELLPYLLLIKCDDVDIAFLKNLRLNLLHLINNFHGSLRAGDAHPGFKSDNSTIFLILLKKLINLNDLLITFIKLIIKPNVKSVMSIDIENFLTVHRQNDASVAVDDDSFFVNLSQRTNFPDGNFSFKSDILSNDLVYTLIGYNFDPITGEPKSQPPPSSSLSMNFINQEISIIDKFFKHDLLAFLNDSASPAEDKSSQGKDAILTQKELSKLLSLINLIDRRLLSNHFKSKYPILIYNNFINFILNDILKFIFLKQQQTSLQRLSRPVPDDGGDGDDDGGGSNSFGNWWVFNSFIQEYISLMGEIVGLYDSI